MAKDVNIHVKTQGTQQVKQDLQDVTQGINKVGDNVEQMGSRSSRALEWFTNSIKSLAGPLGFMAVLGIVGKVAASISSFFDTLKKRCDEAVQKVSELRATFVDLFEVMNAFDEKSRRQVSEETAQLLKETSVSSKVGIPIITEYARQFRPAVEQGKITKEQYQQGLRDMLGYGERHGQESTPELITLMSGQGMITPEQQGAFRRQITELSGQAGMADKDIIEMLGRSMPTIKAMGWTPEQALSVIGVVAQGEIGRQKLALPAAVLEALATPNVTDLQKKYGISQKLARDPQALLAQVTLKSRKMNQQAKLEMLQDIYGSAAPGVFKLVTTPQGDISEALKRAAGPEGEKAEAAEEAISRLTMERVQAQTDAQLLLEKFKVTTPPIEYAKRVREIGEARRTYYRIKEPLRQGIREKFLSDSEEKEQAAMRTWWESLSKEEQEAILNTYKSNVTYWESQSPEEQYNLLQDVDKPRIKTGHTLESPQPAQSSFQPGPSEVHYHYDHVIIYRPAVGDNEVGPRADRSLK